MNSRGGEKVVKMTRTAKSEALVPEVITRKPARRKSPSSRVQEVLHRHRHEHFLMSQEPALTPRDFRDIAMGIEALERAENHRHGRRRSDMKLGAVCALAAPLVFCGLIKLLGLH